jgi:hypothetical protein
MLAQGLTFEENWAEIGHEDVELGYRWTSAGYEVIYNPDAASVHYHPHTLKSACRLQETIGRGLHDLERRIPDPRLLERYGVFSWRNSPRAIARGLARHALVNDLTGPLLEDWLTRQEHNTAVSRWLYWKVLLRHTDRGWRSVRAARGGVGERSARAQTLASAKPC